MKMEYKSGIKILDEMGEFGRYHKISRKKGGLYCVFVLFLYNLLSERTAQNREDYEDKKLDRM